MFYVYREDSPETLIINPITKNHIFYDKDSLKKAVEKDAEPDMYEDGESINYVLIDLKNKTFKTLTIYYVITYAMEIEIKD